MASQPSQSRTFHQISCELDQQQVIASEIMHKKLREPITDQEWQTYQAAAAKIKELSAELLDSYMDAFS